MTKALAKVIGAMADGGLDSQVGARICNGIGFLRACFETGALERIERRLDELESLGGKTYGHTNSDRPVVRTH